MSNNVKTQHALNWFYGNICTRKYCDDLDKQRACYEKMKTIIAGREDFLITHKLYIKIMREKHKVCSLNDAEFCKRESNFWKLH